MTQEELKKTGKNGVYRADLDEWFVEGEEPQKTMPTPPPSLQTIEMPVINTQPKLEPEPEPEPTPAVVVDDVKPSKKR